MINKDAWETLESFRVDEYGDTTQNTWYKGIEKDTRDAIDLGIEALKQNDAIQQRIDRCRKAIKDCRNIESKPIEGMGIFEYDILSKCINDIEKILKGE